jgi:hypothetical protein
MDTTEKTLAPLFRAVGETLRSNRGQLNAADPLNGNHGDHMVQVFDVAAQAAERVRGASLADAMQAAAQQLARQTGNGSAQLYALGLDQVAQQFRRYDISLDDLLGYVTKTLTDNSESGASAGMRSGDTLKALVAGLVGWKTAAENQAGQDSRLGDELSSPGGGPLALGALFDLGVAYMQAKARGGERSQVLADAAASASPLSQTPHRYQSGKLAIQALLEAIRRQA